MACHLYQVLDVLVDGDLDSWCVQWGSGSDSHRGFTGRGRFPFGFGGFSAFGLHVAVDEVGLLLFGEAFETQMSLFQRW